MWVLYMSGAILITGLLTIFAYLVYEFNGIEKRLDKNLNKA